jgi:WD40 repeat protein/tRNA A-37 threonylcarbamoyl transferase component Bud32
MNDAERTGRSANERDQSRDRAGDSQTFTPRSEQETIPPWEVGGQSTVFPSGLTQIGRFRIVRELGQGAMGAVYLAEDPELERLVALKIPKFRDEEDERFIKRFYREARAAATLSHPNICQVYDIGEGDGVPFIAMAYVEGQPLSEFVLAKRQWPERGVAKIVHKTALALAEAHGKGVVHRDLKPGNIMLDQRHQPIVMDFGLAGRTEGPGEETLTQTGLPMGTPSYMSPEQVMGDLRQVGPQSDIFSLGVIMYELLTGEAPFQGSTAVIVTQILRDDPRPPSELRPSLDKRLEAVCLKMMAKNPDERYASAAQVAAAVHEAVKGTPGHGESTMQLAAEMARELESRKQEVTDLLRSGRFASAVSKLEGLAHMSGPSADEYVAWANRELARVKALPAEVLEKGAAIVPTAIELLAAHNYSQAVQILQLLPEDYRSQEATHLLGKAQKLQHEANQLNAKVQHAMRTGQYQGLQDVLRRLLEIQPGNLTARELYDKLSTYSPAQRLRFDADGNLLRASTMPTFALLGRIVRQALRNLAHRQRYRKPRRGVPQGSKAFRRRPRIPVVPIALGLFGVTVILLGIVFLLRGGRVTVQIELDPALLSDTTVTVLVDGREIDTSTASQTIKLRRGAHAYEIRRGLQLLGTRQFTVTEGEDLVLRIDLDVTSLEGTDDTRLEHEFEEGEIALSNGNGIMRWQAVPVSLAEQCQIEDGTVRSAGTPFYLWTKKAYSDFKLRIEYRLRGTANGGVLLRSAARCHKNTPSFAMQLEFVQSGASQDPPSGAAGIHTIRPPTRDARRHDDWNQLDVLAEGRKLLVKLNDVEIHDVDLDRLAAEHPGKLFLRRAGGYIGIEFYSGEVEYRNIEITELADYTLTSALAEPLEIRRFQGQAANPRTFAMTPDGEQLAVSPHSAFDPENDETHPIRLLDVATGREVRSFDWPARQGPHDIPESVLATRVSSDGEFLCGAGSFSVGKWNLKTGERVLASTFAQQILHAVVVSDNSELIAIHSDGTLRHWDVPTGIEKGRFTGHEGTLECLAASAEGETLIAGGADHRLHCWDIENATYRCALPDHTEPIRALDLSPDGTRALSAGGAETAGRDFAVRYWDLAEERLIRRLKGHTSPVTDVCFSPDGRLALTGQQAVGRDPSLAILWDLEASKEVCLLFGASPLVFTPDGQHALTGTAEDGAVRLWRLPEIDAVAELQASTPEATELPILFSPPIPGILPGPKPVPGFRSWQAVTWRICHRVEDIAFSPDDTQIACAAGPYVRVYDSGTLELRSILAGQTGFNRSVCWSPKGRRIAAGGTDGKVRIWNVDGSLQTELKDGNSVIYDVDWSPDGTLLAVADQSNDLLLWSPDGRIKRRVPQQSPVFCTAWSPDGEMLAVGLRDGVFVVSPDGHPLPGFNMDVWAEDLAWSPHGSMLAAARGEFVWLLDEGREELWKQQVEGWGSYTQVSWKPDGQQLVVSLVPDALVLDTKGEIQKELKRQGAPAVAWNHGGDRLVLGGRSGQLSLLNTATWDREERIRGGCMRASSISWSRDSQLLASGHEGGQGRVWKCDGYHAHRFHKRGHGAQCVAFSPTDDHVLTAGYPNKFTLWNYDGEYIGDFDFAEEQCLKVAWCFDGRRFAGAGYGAPVEIRNVDGSKLSPVDLPSPLDMEWNPVRDQLAMARGGKGVLLWNPAQNSEQWIPTRPAARRIAWDREGRRLAVAGDRHVAIVNMSGEPLAQLPHVAGGHISDVCWHPTGRVLAYADGTLPYVLIASSGGERITVLSGHTGPVNSVEFSPDGRWLATGGEDSLVVIRDAEKYEITWVGVCLPDGESMAGSPDGSLRHGDPKYLEEETRFLTETDEGRQQILKRSEFDAWAKRSRAKK